jgi:hypothetical protein
MSGFSFWREIERGRVLHANRLSVGFATAISLQCEELGFVIQLPASLYSTFHRPHTKQISDVTSPNDFQGKRAKYHKLQVSRSRALLKRYRKKNMTRGCAARKNKFSDPFVNTTT